MEHINLEKFLFFLRCDISRKGPNDIPLQNKKVSLILTINSLYIFE